MIGYRVLAICNGCGNLAAESDVVGAPNILEFEARKLLEQVKSDPRWIVAGEAIWCPRCQIQRREKDAVDPPAAGARPL